MNYLIKHGGVWANGKLIPTGGNVELSDEDRELIDPNHTDLQSGAEADTEASKLSVDADLAKARAAALARVDAEHAAKLKQQAADAKKKAEDDAKKKKSEGGGA